MNYYLYHKTHNITFKSKKEIKRKTFPLKDSLLKMQIDSVYKNPWNFDNLKYILNSSNYSKIKNLLDENAKYKTELEYHSNFGLFITRANRTYKPGLYFSMQNYKKDLFSKKNLGISWTDVYDHNSTIFYFMFDRNPKFKKFLTDVAEKFNFTNPNERLDLNLISKIDDIGLGWITSFFWQIPNSKHKVGTYLKIEQSFKSAKNQKLALALSWSKLKSYDLYVKMRAVGFGIESLNEKVIEEIRKTVYNKIIHLFLKLFFIHL